MLKNTVSVIVPAYNRKDYIKRCIDSILAQTYQNIEIVIVDDGSKDGTLDICRKYAREYENIITIGHPSNLGQSAARNNGLNAANGEWIIFLDSDDTFEADVIAHFVDLMREHDVDFVLSGYRVVTADGKEKDVLAHLEDGVYTVGEVADRLGDALPVNIVTCIGSKLYKAEVLRNKKKTNQDISRGEDSAFAADVLAVTDQIYYTNWIGYTYYLRNTDCVTGSYHERMYESFDLVADSFRSFFEHAGDYCSYELKFQRMRYGFFIESLRQEIWYGRKFSDFKQTFRKISGDQKNAETFDIIAKNDPSKRHRMMVFLMTHGFSLAAFVVMKAFYAGGRV